MKKKKVNSIDTIINDEMIEKIETNKSINLYGGYVPPSTQPVSDCYHTIQDQTCGGQDQCRC